MNSANTIAGAWDAFSAIAIHRDAPDIQRREMQMAFYAGAAAVLGIPLDIASARTSEEAGMHMLQGLHEEANAFALRLLDGKPS